MFRKKISETIAVLTLCQIWTLKKIMPKTIQKRTSGMPITLNISTIYIYFTREGVLKTLKRLEERMINGQDMGPCFNKRDESRI